MRKDRNILCIFAEYMSMKFTLQHKDPSSHARAGELHTDHGVIRTWKFAEGDRLSSN